MTREILQQTYSCYTVEQLWDVMDNASDYTELAVAVAQEELSKRDLSENEINLHIQEKNEKEKKLLAEKQVKDLSLSGKFYFFILIGSFVSLLIKVKPIDKDALLKQKQIVFFLSAGIICVIITIIVACVAKSVFDLRGFFVIGFYVACFIVSLLINSFFCKNRYIRDIKEHLSEQK